MRTLFVLFILLSVSTSQAQYIVINVKESVYADKELLKKKDKISGNAMLLFSSAEAYVYVMSPGKGYFILGVKERKKEKGEFLLALKDALLPPKEFYAASTRSQDWAESTFFEDQYDMKAFFRNELFFVGTTRFEVSPDNFPLNDDHFFIIKHQILDKWVSKQLPQHGQFFEISPEVFQLQDQTLKESSVQRSALYFVNKKTGEELFLGNFKLKFVAPDIVKEELATLYAAIGNMPEDEFFREHAMPYLNVLYGRTQLNAIRQLVPKSQEIKH